MIVAVACGGTPGNAGAPGGDVAIEVGKSAPYRLYTHCGIHSAQINGQTFYANPPLSDGSGNPPSGWGNPYDDGTMTLRSPGVADFSDWLGHSAHFTAGPGRAASSVALCS